MASDKHLRLTLVRSVHGRLKRHQACVRGLGLRRMHQSVTVEDTPSNRGMVNRVSYLLEIEEITQ
jgi:large subunit ribosomal protein L30